MTRAGGSGLRGGDPRTGVMSVADSSGTGSGAGRSSFTGVRIAVRIGIFPSTSTSSGIIAKGAGFVQWSTTFENGRTISGATPCRTEGRNPVSPVTSGITGVSVTASLSCWLMLSWIRLLIQSSRSGFRFSDGFWEKTRWSGCRASPTSPERNRSVMTGSCAVVFPPCTDRMVVSGIIRGSNRAFRLSIKKIRSLVSMTSYITASALTRFVVRIMASPLFRYGLPMLSPVLYHFVV